MTLVVGALLEISTKISFIHSFIHIQGATLSKRWQKAYSHATRRRLSRKMTQIKLQHPWKVASINWLRKMCATDETFEKTKKKKFHQTRREEFFVVVLKHQQKLDHQVLTRTKRALSDVNKFLSIHAMESYESFHRTCFCRAKPNHDRRIKSWFTSRLETAFLLAASSDCGSCIC